MAAKIVRVTNSSLLAPGWYYIPAVGQKPVGPYDTKEYATNASQGLAPAGTQPPSQPFV